MCVANVDTAGSLESDRAEPGSSFKKMRTIQTVAVATLLLLLPVQVGLADSSAPQAQVEADAPDSDPQPAESPAAKETTEGSEGFVFSTSTSPRTSRVWSPSSGHRAADGYSWSTVRPERVTVDRGHSR